MTTGFKTDTGRIQVLMGAYNAIEPIFERAIQAQPMSSDQEQALFHCMGMEMNQYLAHCLSKTNESEKEPAELPVGSSNRVSTILKPALAAQVSREIKDAVDKVMVFAGVGNEVRVKL